MINEEKLYQFGDLVFQQKFELQQSLTRETKDYETSGAYDGDADDFGFGRHPFKAYKLSIDHTIQDDVNNLKRIDWAKYSNQLLTKGKQTAFFSTIDDNYTPGDPVILYNYGHISKYDPDYFTRSKKMKYDLKLDTPVFYDCTNTVKYLSDSAITAPANLYNTGKTWTTGLTWSNLPPYQTISSLTNLQIVQLFGQLSENGKGKLYLEDQFFFNGNYVMPTWNGSNDFVKNIPSASFFGSSGNYQTSFTIGNLRLNGSFDNYCYILNIDRTIMPGEYIEIINENNLTGIRLENISSQPIYGVSYYNQSNRDIYDNFGQKLNKNSIQMTKTIPDQALDYLYLDTTINSSSQFYPSIKINSNSNTATNFKLKNQRMYI